VKRTFFFKIDIVRQNISLFDKLMLNYGRMSHFKQIISINKRKIQRKDISLQQKKDFNG